MGEPRRRRHQDRPVRVVWRDGNDWSKVHYVGEISVVGMAAIALDRSVMVFSMSTMCGLDVPTEPEPRFGEHIKGKPKVCSHCAALYAKLPHILPS